MKKTIHQPRFGRKKSYVSLVRTEISTEQIPTPESSSRTNTNFNSIVQIPQELMSNEYIAGVMRMNKVKPGALSFIDEHTAWAEGVLDAFGISTDWKQAIEATRGNSASLEFYAAMTLAAAHHARECLIGNRASGAAYNVHKLVTMFYHASIQPMTEAILRGINETRSGKKAEIRGAPEHQRKTGKSTLEKLKVELKKRGWSPENYGIAKSLAGVNGLPKNVTHMRRLLRRLKSK